MAYNWDAINAQAMQGLAPQGPGLGQQFAQKAANKIATDQVAKLGLQAAGTAAAGPLGGVAGQVAGELAGPLASQFVGSLFNKGGAVYKQGGGQAIYDWLYSIDPGAAAKYISAITDTSGELKGTPANAGEIVVPNKEQLQARQQPASKPQPKPEVMPTPKPAVVAPRSKASAQWNIPLGQLGGWDIATQGSYSDMDKGKDPYSVGLTASTPFSFGAGDAIAESARLAKERAKTAGPNSSEYWTSRGYSDEEAMDKVLEAVGLEQGGDVKQKGWWDKAKSAVSKAASHAWKNDNLEKPAGRWKNVQYKNIGGMTPGPLGMSDLLVAGKDKAISKVKLKKAKGDMSEEVEYNYHPPLAAKPKPTGE